MAYQLPAASIGNPSAPKIFPGMLGVLMVGLAIIVLVQEARAISAGDNQATSKEPGIDLENARQIGLTTVCGIIYAVLFDRVGYVIATIIFLEGVLSIFNGYKNWKQNTLVAVIFSVVVYVLFFKILNVYLPPFPFFE
jgi:putative tricarboxylic transport membrane protein